MATGLSVLDSQHLLFKEILRVDIAKYYIQLLVFPVLDNRTLLAEVCVVQFCQDDLNLSQERSLLIPVWSCVDMQ